MGVSINILRIDLTGYFNKNSTTKKVRMMLKMSKQRMGTHRQILASPTTNIRILRAQLSCFGCTWMQGLIPVAQSVHFRNFSINSLVLKQLVIQGLISSMFIRGLGQRNKQPLELHLLTAVEQPKRVSLFYSSETAFSDKYCFSPDDHHPFLDISKAHIKLKVQRNYQLPVSREVIIQRIKDRLILNEQRQRNKIINEKSQDFTRYFPSSEISKSVPANPKTSSSNRQISSRFWSTDKISGDLRISGYTRSLMKPCAIKRMSFSERPQNRISQARCRSKLSHRKAITSHHQKRIQPEMGYPSRIICSKIDPWMNDEYSPCH